MEFFRFIISKYFLKHLGLAVLISVSLLLLTLLWLQVFTHHGRYRPVPDFYGLAPEEAIEFAREKKLRAEVIDSVYNARAERGTVVEQNPRAGELVKRNRRVSLTINAVNIEMVTVPGVVGLSHRQAKAVLETNGLVVGRLSYMPDLAINNVLVQKYKGEEVAEGDTVPKGARIDLVLGTGLSNRRTVAPDLIGRTFDEARDRILDAALNIGAVLYDESVLNEEDSLQAFVWKQNPVHEEENLIRLGSPVYLWLTVDSTKLPQPDTLEIILDPQDARLQDF
jgi:beta-lactam-binding protein with PASTA domain